MGSSSRIRSAPRGDHRRHVHARPLPRARAGRAAARSPPRRAGSARAACAPRPRAARSARGTSRAGRARRAAAPASAGAAATVPRTSTSPASGSSAPESRCSSVLLPAPLGPTSATRSPPCSVRSAPAEDAVDRDVAQRGHEPAPGLGLRELDLERRRVARHPQPVLRGHLALQAVLARPWTSWPPSPPAACSAARPRPSCSPSAPRTAAWRDVMAMSASRRRRRLSCASTASASRSRRRSRSSL